MYLSAHFLTQGGVCVLFPLGECACVFCFFPFILDNLFGCVCVGVNFFWFISMNSS